MRHFRTCLIIIVTLISPLVTLATANAQSIPLLTDPIKIREIEVASTRLELTPAQITALLEVYDRYVEDFSRVRNGDVKDFEDAITSMAEQFGFMDFSIPERAVIEEIIAQGLKAIRSIQRVDKLFFDEISGMLTEQQRKELDRLQKARELEAYNIFVLEMMGQLNNGVQINLRTIFDRYELEIAIEAEEILNIYDQRFLRNSRDALDSLVQMISDVLDVIDELGIRNMDQQQMMMRFMNEESIEDLKIRGDVILQPIQAMAFEMSQLNWKTWKQLDDLLNEEDSYTLRKNYFSRAYREAVRGESRVDKYFERALKFEDLNEGQVESLNEARVVFRGRWKSRAEKHAKVLEQSRKSRSIDQMTGPESGEYDEDLARYDDQRQEMVESTEAKIDSILGTEILARLQEGKSDKHTHSASSKDSSASSKDSSVSSKDSSASDWDGQKIVDSEGNFVVELKAGQDFEVREGEVLVEGKTIEVEGDSVVVYSADDQGEVVSKTVSLSGGEAISQDLAGGVTIPQPIAPSFPDKASAILALDEPGRLTINAVYDDYRDKYDELVSSLKQIGESIESNIELETADRYKKVRESNDTSASNVAELDRAFFDDLAILTGLNRENADLLMLESHRERQRTASPDNPFGFGASNGETIDLVGLYLLSRESENLARTISQDASRAIRFALQKYHDKITIPHEEFVQASTSLKRTQDAMNLMWNTDATTSASPSGEMAEKMQERWLKAFAAVRDTKRIYMLENQLFIDGMLEALPESDFWNVRLEFVQKAYPDVFRDKQDATTMLNAALSIQDLDTNQQAQLRGFIDTYRYQYWDICERMIETHQQNASAQTESNAFMNQADMQREIQRETLRFERGELYNRAQFMLRLILNDEQIKQVPGLRPSAENAKEWNKK